MKIKVFIILFLQVLTFGCNNQKQELKKPISKEKELVSNNKVSFYLPYESSNSEEEINFKLFNEEGELCRAIIDTVTKTGGHIYYILPKGKYKYSIHTMFNETISKSFEVNSNNNGSIYDNCYNSVNVIEKYDLSISKSIKLVVIYDDAKKKDKLEVNKIKNQYWLKIKKNSDKKWRREYEVDSMKLIDNISMFESVIVGNQLVKNYGENVGYDYIDNKVYMKSDSLFLEVLGMKNDVLKTAFNELLNNLED